MKAVAVLFLLILAGNGAAYAQTSFSCEHRQVCYWSEDSETFENCEGADESSLFVLNEDETMFTHTTETIKSTYYIKKRTYEEDSKLWIYKVVSDVGNEYTYYFDPTNKQIRALILSDEQSVLVVFTIKAVF